MEIKLCGKKYDCGHLSVEKYHLLNDTLESFGECALFEKPYTAEMTESAAETLSAITDRQLTKEDILEKADFVDVLLAYRTIQAESVARFNDAADEIENYFFPKGGDKETSPPEN